MSFGSAFKNRLILVWLLCAATATLAPFDFGAPPPGREEAFTGFSDGSQQQEPIHVVLNMLLFAPLGALLHRSGQSRAHKLVSIVMITGATAFLISFGVEWLQRFLPGREPSFVDISANTAGALVGVIASRSWHEDAAKGVRG
jgi:glycopeptide antibiotics resistance protein